MHVLHGVSNVAECKGQKNKSQGKFLSAPQIFLAEFDLFSNVVSAQKDGQLGTPVYGHARENASAHRAKCDIISILIYGDEPFEKGALMLYIEHLTKTYQAQKPGMFKKLANKLTTFTNVSKDAGKSQASQDNQATQPSRPQSATTFAVRDLSLRVEPGDIFAFIGPNGAGKTTTIKSVVGIHSFDKGTITIGGHSIVDDPIAAKRVFSYLPDNPSVYEYLTGIEYLQFVADMYGISQAQAKARMQKYADMFDITSKLNMRAADFSHGMKQKLAIIAALLHNPQLLILDEPFVGLDPEATLHFKEIMHEICENGGAVFYSTHVLEVAEKLCNKAAMIKDGRLVAQGTMAQLTQNASLETLFMDELGENAQATVQAQAQTNARTAINEHETDVM